MPGSITGTSEACGEGGERVGRRKEGKGGRERAREEEGGQGRREGKGGGETARE